MATPGIQSGTVAGIVKGVDGVATAMNANGVIRVLKPGDKVYAGETVQTADGASAHIDFSRGGFATLGAGQSLPLDGMVLSQAADAAKPQPGQTQTPAASDADVGKLQQQIEEAVARGEDPTQLLEAAAAGPGAGGGGGEEGSGFVLVEQAAARGNVTPGFDTGTFGNPVEDPFEYTGEIYLANLDVSFDSVLSLASHSVNESEGGFNLYLNLDKMATSTITVTIQLSGSAIILQNEGAGQEYRSDISLPGGASYSYDPATGLLTVTIPAGSWGVTVPVSLLDDHITDGDKDLTFTVVGVDGPVNVSGMGSSATVTITEDTNSGNRDGISEINELDGPIVGITNTGPQSLYEGSEGGPAFVFLITLNDPHNPAANYSGYQGDMLLSQNLTITLQVGGSAACGTAAADAGTDYHFRPGAGLASLIQSGVVLVQLNADGSIKVNADGTINLTLVGQVDENGNINSSGQIFSLNDLGDLTIDAIMHINGEGSVGESAENITLGIAGVSGNESQIASGGSAGVEVSIDADPVLAIAIGAPSVNESEGSFSLNLSFDKSVAGADTVTILLSVGGDATIWNGDPATKYASDYLLPGTYVSGSSPAQSELTVNGQTFTFTLNSDGSITVSGPASAFMPDGSGSYSLIADFPVNDDHLTESDESITFTVDQVTLDDGTYSGTVGGAGSVAGITISEDNVDADGNISADVFEKDGPVVGIQINGGNSIQEVDGTAFEYQITLQNPHGGGDYTGYEGDGELSETMTLTVTVGGTATQGADYTLDFSALDSLVSQGMLDYTVNPDGSITLTLYGKADCPPGKMAFDLSRQDSLTVTAEIINDQITERVDETITLSVSTDGQNESTGGGTVTGTIDKDTPSVFNGPTLILTGPDTINESANALDTYASEDNTATYAITLDKPAAEDIRVTLTLTDGTATLGSDYEWAGNIAVTYADGSTGILTASYNAVTGQYELTIPKDAIKVDFDVTIIDDLRENEGAENYTVSLDLVLTDAAGLHPGDAGYDAASGLPDSEATLGSNSVTTNIIEDARTGGSTNLNPADFDGPFVSITADKNTVNESPDNPGTPNTVAYTIALTNPDGQGVAYAADEGIAVTLKIAGSDTFTLSDLFAPNSAGVVSGQITITFLDASGSPLLDGSGNAITQTVTVTGNAWDTSANLTVNLPAGAASAGFELPINDDPLGASAGSQYDKSSETLTVEIVGLEGNEARADTSEGPLSAETTIVDDTADDPGITTDDASLEGITVGLARGNSSSTSSTYFNDATVNEGTTQNLYIRLFDKGGDPYGSAAFNNPYAGYTQQSSATILPDNLVITMTFTDTRSGGDLALKASSNLITLVRLGQVILEIGGKTYNSVNYSQLSGLSIQDGTFTVTLVGGKFDMASYGSLYFQAVISGDNVNEWDSSNQYVDSDKSAEQFTLSIDKVEGNESAIATNSSGGQLNDITVTISDIADGKLTFDKTTVAENDTGTGWYFKVNVSYNANESNLAPGEIAQRPGEAVHFQLKISDSDVMQNGEEYMVSAWSLFVSMNHGMTDADLQAFLNYLVSNGYTGDESGYMNFLNSGADLLALAELYSIILVTGQDGSGSGSTTFDVYVSTAEFNNGNIDFTIDKGPNSGLSTTDGFTVEFVDPYNGKSHSTTTPDFDMKGEIVNVGPEAQVTVKDKIVLSLDNNKTIYEDTGGDSNKSDYDSYKVTFTNESGTPQGQVAADLTYTMTLKPGSAAFDWDTTDNWLVSKMGDFALCDENGSVMAYSDQTTLLQALNDWLEATYGTNAAGDAYVTVTGIDTSSGNISFYFDIKEGFDLSNGVTIHFAALDDNVSDSGEHFTVQISNVHSSNGSVDDPLDLSIASGKNQGTTTILDETGSSAGKVNGYAIGLEDAKGIEAIGGAEYIDIAARAYILDSADGTSHGEIMTLADFEALYARYTGTPGYTYSAGDTAFIAFIEDNFKPTQDIMLNVSYGNWENGKNLDDAQYATDYKPGELENKVEPSEWTLVIDADGNVYFWAESGVKVETIDDNLQEGNENFTVTLDSTSGNESRPLTPAEDSANDGTSTKITGTIEDTHDGPILVYFGPDGSQDIREPVDTAHGPANGEQHVADPRVVEYTIRLDSVASEDVCVWISVKSGEGFATHQDATTGDFDFSFGEGIYYYDKVSDTVHSINGPEGTLADFWLAQTGHELPDYVDGSGWFTIIEKGEGSASFQVNLLDDNKEESENIALSITDMQGSEVQYADGKPWADNDPDNPYSYESSVILEDDMRGPVVSLSAGSGGNYVEGSGTAGYEPEITIRLQDYCDEDVTVTVNVYDMNLGTTWSFEVVLSKLDGSMLQAVEGGGIVINLVDYLNGLLADGALTQVQYDAILGQISGTNTDFYIGLGGVEGGEARSDDSLIFFDNDSGYSPLIITDLTSTNIVEGNPPDGLGTAPEYTLGITVQEAHIGGDESFTLTFRPDSAGLSDVDDLTSVTVTFSEQDLKDLANRNDPSGNSSANVEDYVIKITEGPSGDPVIKVYYNDGSGTLVEFTSWTDADGGPQITGDLPTALGDTVAEGSESFQAIITNPSGGVDIDTGPASTVIEDKTYVGVVFVDADGNPVSLTVSEGVGSLELTAMLVLTDEHGTPILDGGKYIPATASADLAFDLTYTGSGSKPATAGSDYTGDSVVRFDAGQSESKVTIIVHQDDYTEGEESFTISASLSEASKAEDGGVADRVTDTGSTAEITIKDDGSGPRIEVDINKTVKEGGSVGIFVEAFNQDNGMREVVSENVTLTFELKLDGTLSLADIEYITVDGVNYYVKPIGGQSDIAIFETAPGSGVYVFTCTLTGGLAYGTVATIKTRDDVISEGDETFTLTLKDVTGSEAVADSSAYDPQTITVTENENGPVVNLVAGEGSEETGTVSVTVTLGGDSDTRATEETSTVTLKLDQAAIDRLAESTSGDYSDVITVSGGATFVSYDPATGKLVIELPVGADRGDEYEVTFNIKDDSLAQEGSFVVSLTDVDKGELSIDIKLPVFSSSWDGEQGSVPGTHGGSNSFVVSTSDTDGLASLDLMGGNLKITVGGLVASGGDASAVVKSIIIDGTAYTYNDGSDTTNNPYEAGQYYFDASGNAVIIVDELKGTYNMEVVYDKDADASYAKANAHVSEAKVVDVDGATVAVVIENETTASELDPLTVSITALDTSVDEGGILGGTLTLDMADLPGDPGALAGDVKVTLNIGGTAGSVFTYTLPDGTVKTATVDSSGNVIITIPQGTDITGGKVDVAFTVAIPDNNVVGDTSVTVEVTGVQADAYEKAEPGANASATATVTDNDTVSLRLAASSAQVNQGSNITYTVGFGLNGSGTPGLLAAALAFVLDLDGLTALQIATLASTLDGRNHVAATDNGDGTITVTLEEGYNLASGLGFTVTAQDNSVDHTSAASVEDSYTVTISSIDGDTDSSITANIASGQDSAETVINLNIQETAGDDTIYSGDGNDIIYGGDGNDIIYGGDGNDIIDGGAGNDTIYGGAGNNILTGGEGNDIFAYNLDSLRGKSGDGDLITDFRVGNITTDTDADVLDISELLSGMGQSGSSLSDLITNGYLKLEVVDNGNGTAKVTLGIDQDGSAGGSHDMQTLATIQMDNVSFVDHGPSGPSLEQQLLDQLMNNDQIKF